MRGSVGPIRGATVEDSRSLELACHLELEGQLHAGEDLGVSEGTATADVGFHRKILSYAAAGSARRANNPGVHDWAGQAARRISAGRLAGGASELGEGEAEAFAEAGNAVEVHVEAVARVDLGESDRLDGSRTACAPSDMPAP